VTTFPNLPAGHVTTAAEMALITPAGMQRSIPLRGVNVTNTGSPIATTSGTTELDLAKYALTGLTLVTGRYYLARYSITFTKTVGSDVYGFKLRANTAVSGTQISAPGSDPTDALTVGDREVRCIFKGDASYTSLYFSVTRTGGTGTFSYYGAFSASLMRTWGALYDLGDSDNWSDVA